MNVLILLFGEIHTAITLAVDSTSQVIATIANTFNLGHFTQHSPDFQFTFRTQTTLRHLIQIIGNFNLHAVADVFILFDTAIQLVEVVFIAQM